MPCSSRISQSTAGAALTLSSFPAAADKQSMQSALSLPGLPAALGALVKSSPLLQREEETFVLLVPFRKQHFIATQTPGGERSSGGGELFFP